MNLKKTAIFRNILMILVILLHSISSYAVKASESDLIDQQIADLFISNLLSSYNALIKFFEISKSYFTSYEDFYSLYSEEGYSYRVILVKAEHNYSENICFIFIPIQSNYPDVVIDDERAFSDYFPGFIKGMKNIKLIVKGGLFEYKDTYVYADFIASSFLEDILNNTLINSKNLADEIYAYDLNLIRMDRINDLWIPFKEEFKDIISNYYLNDLQMQAYTIDFNVYNDTYTYEKFLIDFSNYNKIVYHYKDMNVMLENYNDFKESQISGKSFLIENIEIQNKLLEIENNIISNESYLIEHYESDMDELEIITNNLKENRTNMIQKRDTSLAIFGLLLTIAGFFKRSTLLGGIKRVYESIFPSLVPKYVGNEKSKIFHYRSCRSVDTIKRKYRIGFKTKELAESQGYRACSNCNP